MSHNGTYLNQWVWKREAEEAGDMNSWVRRNEARQHKALFSLSTDCFVHLEQTCSGSLWLITLTRNSTNLQLCNTTQPIWDRKSKRQQQVTSAAPGPSGFGWSCSRWGVCKAHVSQQRQPNVETWKPQRDALMSLFSREAASPPHSESDPTSLQITHHIGYVTHSHKIIIRFHWEDLFHIAVNASSACFSVFFSSSTWSLNAPPIWAKSPLVNQLLNSGFIFFFFLVLPHKVTTSVQSEREGKQHTTEVRVSL